MSNLKEIVCTPEKPFGVEREMSDADQKLYDDKQKEFNDNSANRKLSKIKQLRLERLQETDFYALSDVTLSTEMSTYRQKLRDIPADYDSSKYDELLNRNEQGQLTHTVWEKP